MKKRLNLKFLSVLCVVVLVFLAVTTFAFSAKKEMVQEWISAEDGGSITLLGVTIEFEGGILTKDTKIHIIYFGNGEYQFGPEIDVNGEFTITFANAPSDYEVVLTFKQGEWIELDCIDGVVVTNHFSRYAGAW
jgi:hypothetical protein